MKNLSDSLLRRAFLVGLLMMLQVVSSVHKKPINNRLRDTIHLEGGGANTVLTNHQGNIRVGNENDWIEEESVAYDESSNSLGVHSWKYGDRDEILSEGHLQGTDEEDYHSGEYDEAFTSMINRRLPEGKVKLCRHDYCSDGVYYAGAGTWNSMPDEIGNNQLSWVIIPRGYKFHYFENTHLNGWNKRFGSKLHRVNLNMGGHNDAVSSFKIWVDECQSIDNCPMSRTTCNSESGYDQRCLGCDNGYYLTSQGKKCSPCPNGNSCNGIDMTCVLNMESTGISSVKYLTHRKMSITCKNEPFFYPETETVQCMSSKNKQWYPRPSCRCGRCQDLPKTSQIKAGRATVTYRQKPPETGKDCQEELHPVNTEAAIICSDYPYSFPTDSNNNNNFYAKCDVTGTWSRSPPNGRDYCLCAVQCSGFCLGVGDNHKTSIAEIGFEWTNHFQQEINWVDSCSTTDNANYKIDIYRSYWNEASQNWSEGALVQGRGVEKNGRSYMTDSNIQRNVPDNISYSPGLRIKYRWSQKTIVGSYSPQYISPAVESEQVTRETTLPFFFSFTYLLTSPDGRVDIAGANLTITDTSSGSLLFSTLTKKRGITSLGKKEEPERISVQLPNWRSLSREMNVTVTYLDHDILCDKLMCTNRQHYWVGTINHLEEKNLFFTDFSVVTMKGTVKNQGCPVKGVNFQVKSLSGEIIETFDSATDSKGEFKIFGPIGDVIVEPYLAGHELRYNGIHGLKEKLFSGIIEKDVSGFDFSDITTRNMTLNIVGGDKNCNASIGSGFANLQVSDGCYNKYFPIQNDAQSHTVPALNFNLKVDVFSKNQNYQWNWEADQKFQNFDEYMIATEQYNDLGWHELDATSNDVKVTFRYHPIVTISDIKVAMGTAENMISTECNQGINSERKSGNETISCNRLISPDDRGDLWLFKSSIPSINQTIQFEIKETYGSNQCPAQGFLRVRETWSSDSTYMDQTIHLDGEGIGSFQFVPGLPEFGCPFTKSFFYKFISVDDEISALGSHDEANFLPEFEVKAIIVGQAKAFDQTMHVTSPETILPLMILRDPPGANSFSSVTESKQISLETSMQAAFGGGTSDQGQSGAGTELYTGLGVMSKTEWVFTYEGGLKITRTQTNDAKHTITVETTKTFKSSEDPALTGKYGDVIVGLGLTATIRPGNGLRWDKSSCTVTSTKTIGFESDVNTDDNGNLAIYSYTHWYIESVIIPELRMIEQNSESTEEQKNHAKKTRENWRTILEDKDEATGIDPFGQDGATWEVFEKFVKDTDALWDDVRDDGLLSLITISTIASGASVMAAFVSSLNVGGAIKFGITAVAEMAAGWTYTQDQQRLRNRYDDFKEEYSKFKTLMIRESEEGKSISKLTIDGGHAVSGSTATSKGTSRTIEFDFELNSEFGTWAKTDIAVLEAESSSKLTSVLTVNQANTNFELSNTVYDWTIHDPDIGDHYLIDIKEDQNHGSPMFEVLSGRSLCRHELNTVAREGVEITIEGESIRHHLNPLEPAVFLVKLRHTGYDPIYPWYNVRLMRSEMKGLTGLITLGGHPLTNFIEFTNLEKDQWVEVELVVHRSYITFFFENLTLEMYSQCEDEFSRNQMPVDIIHDTVSVSASWAEPCAEAEIMPNVDFVSIKASSVVQYPVTISNPSHQVKPWYRINGLGMKLVWKVWTPDDSASKQYAKNEDGITIVKNQEDFEMERSSKTSILWNTAALNDGKYSLQVEMDCPDQALEYTKPKTVYIQREELQVSGYTQPPDGGDFSFDEDVVVRFNRDLNCFNPNTRIGLEIIKGDTYDIPMHMICKGNTIVATLTVATDLYRIAGKDLRVTLVNVMDFAGNYLNSEDGVSSYNGISWLVRAQGLDEISALPARMSMCIDSEVIVGISINQLKASKAALKQVFSETFDYMEGLHKCRLSVSDPYNFDSVCTNGRWDIIIAPSNELSESCHQDIFEEINSNTTDLAAPFNIAFAMNSAIAGRNITLRNVDLTKPLGLSLSSSSSLSSFDDAPTPAPTLEDISPSSGLSCGNFAIFIVVIAAYYIALN